MNASARVIRRSHRLRPRPAPRTAAIIIAAAGLTVLVAACSASPSSTGSRSTPSAGRSANTPSALAYSLCIRSHGVPSFPDPPSGGGVAKASAQQLGVTSAELQAAQRACQRLIPASGGSAQQQEQQCFVANDCSQAVVQRLLNLMLKLALCMRTHGVRNFPDPSTDSEGQPYFDVSAQGISDAATHTPQFIAKLDECQRLTGNFPYTFG